MSSVVARGRNFELEFVAKFGEIGIECEWTGYAATSCKIFWELKALRGHGSLIDIRINESKALRGRSHKRLRTFFLVLDDYDACTQNSSFNLSSGPGDKGVDIEAKIAGIKFVIQCKNWTRQIGRPIIYELEGALTRQPSGTIGVVAGPFKNNFTPGALEAVRTSVYGIILTDKANICKDLIDFVAVQLNKNGFNFSYKRGEILFIKVLTILDKYFFSSSHLTMKSRQNVQAWVVKRE
ncbi:7363_t:CDS:2 [Funneliformis geosporum]|uniref:13046_t:CDS:1 n=1 Tax=Funneliformis geosporum TaxID=1117311 RepID=A0A9W4T3Q2_9GLOM|nr:13046_t:CDS:2 [Funneliformis geosporum]CAI2189620.1 7363_t:CDS:2 [Funneliformis geosporum]